MARQGIRPIAIPRDLWDDFRKAVAASADPCQSRTAVIRGFVLWYTGRSPEPPRRPRRPRGGW